MYRYIAVLACLWRHVYGVQLPFWDAKELRFRNLKINPFSGIWLVSELFDPPTYTVFNNRNRLIFDLSGRPTIISPEWPDISGWQLECAETWKIERNARYVSFDSVSVAPFCIFLLKGMFSFTKPKSVLCICCSTTERKTQCNVIRHCRTAR